MSNNGRTIAIVVAIVVVIAAISGCVIALNNNGGGSKVTYELNYEGAPAGESVSYKSGSEITEPLYPDHRVDHTFAGWYSDMECTNKISFPYKVNSDVTFYAKWTSGIAAKYFNENFFIDNEYGKNVAKSYQMTSGYKEIIVDGKNVELPLISCGFEHFILCDLTKPIDEAYYIIVDFNEKKTLFTLPYLDIAGIMSVDLLTCNTEFIVVVDYDDQYWIYDLKGNAIGPSELYPSVLLHDKIIFDDKCFTFNNDGSFKLQFDITSYHVPDAGDGTTYVEIDSDINEGLPTYKAYNLLDDKFNIVESFPIPESAVDAVCFYIGEGCYFLQYSLLAGPDYYTYSDNGVYYELETFVLNTETREMKGVSYDNPAFISADLLVDDGFAATLAPDIKNIISFYKVDENKVLDRNGKLLWAINPDGSVYKTFSVSEEHYQFSVTYPLLERGKYLNLVVIGEETEEPKSIQCIADGSGKEFKIILDDVKETTCIRYFITDESESSRKDFNIYDANGEVVGNFEGKIFIDSTNNVLFFKDDPESLYAFRDGKMTSIFSGKKAAFDCGESYYCYGHDDAYEFFTEDGTKICDSSSSSCNEILTKNGTHMIQLNTMDGKFCMLELTA